MAPIRVLIADDNPSMLDEVIRLLQHEFEVVGIARDGQAVIERGIHLAPDVFVLDIFMPIISGIEAAARLKQSGSETNVVFLTVQMDPDFVRTCLATGASGYVSKSHLATDLVAAIRCAMEGTVFVSPRLR